MDKTENPLRWGVIGLGLIARDFVLSMNFCKHLQKVVAVSTSHSVEKAVQFCKNLGLGPDTKAYGDYEELFKDPEVEIVYIANMNGTHYECTMKALKAGKHVLCEKPIAVNLTQARKMFAEARSTKLFLMEAFWSRFFPLWVELRRILDSKKYGEVKFAESHFCRIVGTSRKDLPRGESPLLDIGCYTIMFALFVFKELSFTNINVSGRVENGCDLWGNITLEFETGAYALCHYDSTCISCSSASIVFENGQVLIPDKFWCPTILQSTEKPVDPSSLTEQKFPPPDSRIKTMEFNYPNDWGLCYEIDHVFEAVRSGKTESSVMSHSDSLKIMEILDNVRSKLKIVFPGDE